MQPYFLLFHTGKSGALLAIQPDGICHYYGGDESLDIIAEQHCVAGKLMEDLIYHKGSTA
jgi:(2Fe-2S) ferredoxin